MTRFGPALVLLALAGCVDPNNPDPAPTVTSRVNVARSKGVVVSVDVNLVPASVTITSRAGGEKLIREIQALLDDVKDATCRFPVESRVAPVIHPKPTAEAMP